MHVTSHRQAILIRAHRLCPLRYSPHQFAAASSSSALCLVGIEVTSVPYVEVSNGRLCVTSDSLLPVNHPPRQLMQQGNGFWWCKVQPLAPYLMIVEVLDKLYPREVGNSRVLQYGMFV
jgi:hypothetical protein